MRYVQVSGPALRQAAYGLFTESQDFLAAITIGGDRIFCAIWGIAAFDAEHCVDLATFAEHGEERSGQPTIVGVYVLPAFRKAGVGGELFRRVIESIPDEVQKIRVDAITVDGERLVEKLSGQLRIQLEIHRL